MRVSAALVRTLTPPIHAAQRAPNADGDAGDHEFVADSPLEEAGFELSVP